MFRLDGKIALVTGSGGGLGVGIAQALAGQDCFGCNHNKK